jgi:site-specific recombinase XerD
MNPFRWQTVFEKYRAYLLNEVGLAQSTVSEYLRDIKLLYRQLNGDLLLLNKAPEIEDVINRVAESRKWGRKMAYRCRVVVKEYFQWACSWERIIGQNPYPDFHFRKGASPEPEFFEHGAEEGVYLHFNNRFADVVMGRVFAICGCRREAVARLNIEDVDLESRTLHIRLDKRGKWHRVSFDQDTEVLLRLYIKGRSCGRSEALFVNSHGSRLTGHRLWKRFQKMRENCGIEQRVYPHKFRHTVATKIIERGGTVAHVQRHLGHASPSMSQNYIHLTDKEKRKIADRIAGNH